MSSKGPSSPRTKDEFMTYFNAVLTPDELKSGLMEPSRVRYALTLGGLAIPKKKPEQTRQYFREQIEVYLR